MRLTRLHMPNTDFAEGRTIAFNTDQSHYLLRVLRMEQGQAVAVFNRENGAWIGTLVVDGKKASAVLEKQIQAPQPVNDLWLLVSPLKKEAWDFALEKATELGVGAIRPVIMEYTQNARVNDERAMANIVEAAQQSERTHVPDYVPPTTFDKLIDGWDEDRVLFVALERSDAEAAATVFVRETNKKAAILIGPEGGFSPRERDVLCSKKFVKPVSLGVTVLRAETAAVAAVALYLIRPD